MAENLIWSRNSGRNLHPVPVLRKPRGKNRGFPLSLARLVFAARSLPQGDAVPGADAILALLDSRSFGSVWFWVILTLAWTVVGRRSLGVPPDVIAAAGRALPGPRNDPAALMLLDWLSLTLPRWELGPREGTLLLGLGAFLISALAVLGFGYDLEMAQALVLLILPFAGLFALELRLARRLGAVLGRAGVGQPVNEAALEAARLLRLHRRVGLAVSVLSVAATALYGAVWMVTHPFGF
jgi:hypothetical protein